jgi:hypothetical protein
LTIVSESYPGLLQHSLESPTDGMCGLNMDCEAFEKPSFLTFSLLKCSGSQVVHILPSYCAKHHHPIRVLTEARPVRGDLAPLPLHFQDIDVKVTFQRVLLAPNQNCFCVILKENKLCCEVYQSTLLIIQSTTPGVFLP